MLYGLSGYGSCLAILKLLGWIFCGFLVDLYNKFLNNKSNQWSLSIRPKRCLALAAN